jgi:hypothetical protein
MPAKTNIAKASGLMYRYTQAAYAAFALQDGHGAIRLRVFERTTQVQVTREQHKALLRYFEMAHVAGLPNVQEMAVGFIETQMTRQMHVYGVSANCARCYGVYHNVALVEGVE